MRSALPALEIELRRSRTTLVLMIASHGATAAMVATLPLPWLARVGAALVVATMAAFAIRARCGRRRPIAIAVDDRGHLCVTCCDGRQCSGTIAADTYVGSRISAIVWQPSDARIARTLLLTTDGIDGQAFRRLRTRLRYLRIAVPASGSNDDAAG